MFDFTEWSQRNPLKAWRRKTFTTQTNAAAMVGVGVQAMQRWESGAFEKVPGETEFIPLPD